MPLPPRRLAAVLVALASLASPALAQDTPAPNPNDVKAVAVHPSRVALNGSDDAAQLVVHLLQQVGVNLKRGFRIVVRHGL